jgi:hypothetical protein
LLEYEPLTPADQAIYDQKTASSITAGQRRALTDQNLTGVEVRIDQNLTGVKIGTDQNLTASESGTDQNLTGIEVGIDQNLTGFMTHESATTESVSQNQVDEAAAADFIDEATALTLLKRLGIGEPTAGQLAASTAVKQSGYLAAWVRWNEQQNDLGPGWIVKRLREVADPPNLPPLEVAIQGGPALERLWASQTAPESPPQIALWREVVERLRGQMVKASWQACIAGTTVVSDDGETLTIAAPPQAIPWLDNRLRPVISRAVTAIWQSDRHLNFVPPRPDQAADP